MAQRAKSPRSGIGLGYTNKSNYGGKANDEGGRFVSRNLGPINPKSQQFEPTDSEPVRQHFKMAGGC